MGNNRNKKVIYTAIFGNFCGLVPQPPIPNFDYICFTDNPNLKAKSWKVIHTQKPLPDDSTRSNRYVKILAHKFVSDYAYSVYIDANMLVVGDMHQLIDHYLQKDKMAAFSHKNTIPDDRDCIYQEYEAIIDLRDQGLYYKDDPEVLEHHINKLKDENYPPHHGLIKGGCLVRRHNDPQVIKVMEDWWYMVENYSKRDQMSFNYVAWKNNFDYATIPGDIRKGNPYIYWLGNPRKDWSKKVAKIQFKRRLGLLKLPKP